MKMRKTRCPKEEKLILLIFNEIENNEEELINHLSVCYRCQQKLRNYEKIIQGLQKNATILEKVLKEKHKINKKVLNLQHINKFLSNKLLSAGALAGAFLGFLILIFTMYPSDQIYNQMYNENSHNENGLNRKEVENSYLEKIIFEFEEIEQELKGGVFYD